MNENRCPFCKIQIHIPDFIHKIKLAESGSIKIKCGNYINGHKCKGFIELKAK